MNKEEKREYNRKWVAKRRFDFFSRQKCAECNSVKDLELHHIDPSQKEANAIWSWSAERQAAEIEKCKILCTSCHRIETNKQFGYRVYIHGTRTCYQMGCKCSLCRQANTSYRAAHRLKTGKH